MRRPLFTLIAFFALVTPAQAAWVWPVSGDVITPYRNGTDPYASGQHRGIDIGAPVGAPVVAAAGGEVLFAGTAGSSGMTISVRTGDGYDTSYLHLSSLAVRKGARVAAGEQIGAVGTTGSRSVTAPHLHFGVREAGTRHAYHDPLAFLPPPPPSRAPEPQPPAPAPAPQPAPPATVPAPVRRPEPSRPRPAPGELPRPAPRALPAPAPRALPAPAPRTLPGRGRSPRAVPAPLPVPVSVGAPKEVRHGLPSRSRTPLPADTLGAHPGDAARPAGVSNAARPPDGADGRADAGPDIGWALACAGLLLAAAIFTLTGDRGGRTSTGAGRRSPATWLGRDCSRLGEPGARG
jgi:hypothetical protein